MLTPPKIRQLLLLVVAMFVIQYTLGVARVSAQQRLAEATTATCTFPLVAKGTWVSAQPSAAVEAATLTFRFEAIDTEDATAEAVGRFGASHIITRLSGQYLHFMQVFQAGPLYTTTVFNRDIGEGKFMAVHTRHEYTEVDLPGFTSNPEQYYGECEIEP